MHEHDHDLIAALAEGRLAGDSARQAERSLEACPECRRHLELQRRALDFLAAAEQPRLTELERARLRRQVLSRAAPGGVLHRIPWGVVATAAAVLVGVVLLGPVLSGLPGLPGSAGQTADQGRGEQAEPTEETMAAAQEAEGDTATPAAGPESALRTHFEPVFLGHLGIVEEDGLSPLLEHPAFEEVAAYTREDAAALRQRAEDGALEQLGCLEEAYALSERNLVAVLGATATFQGEAALVLGFATAADEDPEALLEERLLWVLSERDCRILHTQGGLPPRG